jgi:hypothetical protein
MFVEWRLGEAPSAPVQPALGAHLPRRWPPRLRGVAVARCHLSAAFAAGNFIYIAASDLIPEVKEERDWRVNLLHFACFVAGIALLYSLRVALEG